jgi:hypothetical protein
LVPIFNAVTVGTKKDYGIIYGDKDDDKIECNSYDD